MDHLAKAREGGTLSLIQHHYQAYLKGKPNDAAVRSEYRAQQRGSSEFRNSRQELLDKSLGRMAMLRRPITGSPDEKMSKSEEQLVNNPYHFPMLMILGRAALEGRYYDVAISTFNDLDGLQPNNIDVMKGLLRSYNAAKRYEELVTVSKKAMTILGFKSYDELSRSKEEQDIKEIIKNAEAEAAVVIREEAETSIELAVNIKQVEQDHRDERVGKDEASTSAKIVDLEERLREEGLQDPDKIKIYTELAEVHERIHDYGKARSALQEAVKLKENIDLEEKIAELYVQDVDDALSEHPNDEALEKRKWKTVVDQYLPLAEKTPMGKPKIHLRYGEGLYELGKLEGNSDYLDEAITVLQKVSTSENEELFTREILLGRCFMEKEYFELSEDYFSDMLKQWEGKGDEGKLKTIHYVLGQVQRQLGKKKEALRSFFAVYQKDSGFLDVKKLVDELHGELKES